MRTLGKYLMAWAVLAGVLYLAINPSIGLFYDRPGVTLAAGLVGLGLVLQAKQRRAAKVARAAAAQHA